VRGRGLRTCADGGREEEQHHGGVVDTSVLLTAVLAASAVIGGAVHALGARAGGEVRDLSRRLERSDEGTTDRLDALGDRLTVVRASLAGLDARVAPVEQGLDGC